MKLKSWLIKGNPEKINELFYTTTEKEEREWCVKRLIELKENKLLEDIYLSSKDISIEIKKNIISLLVKSINDHKKLYTLYKDADSFSKQKIFNKLVEINAEDTLWEIYESEKRKTNVIDMNNRVLDKLIKFNNNDGYKLLELFKKVKLEHHREDITKSLIEAGKEKLLYDIMNPIEATMLIVHCRDYNIEEFFSNLFPLIEYAYSDSVLAKQFFSMLTEKQRLYILLHSYDISEYYPFEEFGLNLSDTKIYYPAVTDCKTMGLTEFSDLFDIVFEEGFQLMDEKRLILALILDRNMFEIKIREIESNRKIVSSLESQTLVITKRYARLMREEVNDSKIVYLLKERKEELDKLLLKSDFEQLNSLLKRKLNLKTVEKERIKLPPLRDFIGKGLNILNLDTEIRITKNYDEEKDKIIKDMEKDIIDLRRAEDVISVKKKANKKLSNIIPRDIFCNEVKSLDPLLSNRVEYIEKLGLLLMKNTDPEVRKTILQFSLNSKNPLWRKYLKTLFPIRDGKIILHTYAAILNIPSSENIIRLVDILDKKIGISNDTIMLYILENSFHIYFNWKEEDLNILYRINNYLSTIKDKKNIKSIMRLLEHLIKNIERSKPILGL
ncbi:MAG: hypothetical protein CR982_06360 [Candidatus Cloacimonadota bacterium]|nr:MAG: hypothetical protein CR982_06360 [Candidatus Cloacimonadota bacterium]PIE77906.1 MAG: hypothetical protein CSA15_10465 [Candidatus Delongbacteria bacterium]